MKVMGFAGTSAEQIAELIEQAAGECERQGLSCAVLTEEDHPCSGECSRPRGAASPGCFAVSYPGKRSLEDILSFFETDIVLVAGFEENETFPRVLCTAGQTVDFNEALEKCAVCTFGPGRCEPLAHAASIPELVKHIAALAFKLPALDCGHCGCTSCGAFAREVVRGSRALQDCVSLQPPVAVSVGSYAMPMNPFISDIIEKTIRGMLSSLKGYRSGPVTIKLP
jgi:molybdopterin-guanine dinucleotide biosynthesis protein B